MVRRPENERFLLDGRVLRKFSSICISNSTNPSMTVLRDAISLLQYQIEGMKDLACIIGFLDLICQSYFCTCVAGNERSGLASSITRCIYLFAYAHRDPNNLVDKVVIEAVMLA